MYDSLRSKNNLIHIANGSRGRDETVRRNGGRAWWSNAGGGRRQEVNCAKTYREVLINLPGIWGLIPNISCWITGGKGERNLQPLLGYVDLE